MESDWNLNNEKFLTHHFIMKIAHCRVFTPFMTWVSAYSSVNLCLVIVAYPLNVAVAGEYAGTQGLGLLRLHSTFRHDLKIYASDEGRVQMTAAAFAKGLLALEGELTPILVQMVKSANTNGLLDNDCDSSKYQNM